MEKTSQNLNVVEETPVTLIEDVPDDALSWKDITKTNISSKVSGTADDKRLPKQVHEAQQYRAHTTDMEDHEKFKNQIADYMRSHGSKVGYIFGDELTVVRVGEDGTLASGIAGAGESGN